MNPRRPILKPALHAGLTVVLSVSCCLYPSASVLAKGKVPPSSTGTGDAARPSSPEKPLSQTFQPDPSNKPLETSWTGEFRRITLEEAKGLWDQKSAFFVDGRSAVSYDTRHIRGALNLPLGDNGSKLEAIKQKAPLDSVLVVYCSSESCGLALRTAETLAKAGYRTIAIFSAGWSAWIQAGYPAEP